MNEEKDERAIIQNLKDAGCSQSAIAAFAQQLRDDKVDEALRLLAAHRRALLDNLHREQKRIDCLDYLAYYMGKTGGAKNKEIGQADALAKK